MSKCNQDDCHEQVKNEQDCPCEPFLQGSMDIIIEEQLEDGSPNQHKNTRYVKICGSSEDCRVYPIIIDETTGVGTLHLEDIKSVQNVIVFVDDNGQQMMNGDEYTISYYHDGEKQEEDSATVVMSSQGRDHHEIRIVNQHRQLSHLEITKILRDEFRDPLEITCEMRFLLHLSGMGVEETIVLDAQNDFHIELDHLHPGIYTLVEEEMCGYCTMYRFDGDDEMNSAEFELSGGMHDLEVINQRLSQSILTIDKYIRDDRGELIKPMSDECFEIRIIGDSFDGFYTLNCENDFCIELTNLEPGFYDVREQTGNYEVSYMVNHQMECAHAHVEVRKCGASSVMVINTPMGSCDCSSPLRICKYMRRQDGCLVRPNDDACFKVMLSGCGFYQTFNLNACNNFCVDIDNICCGEYEICEIDNECYRTSYIVNDERESTSAILCLHENECNCVRIINEERNNGSIRIGKYIRNHCGDLVKPMKGDRFVATLRSFFFCETFVLDEQNDWCMYFDHLREGSYEIRERCIDGYDTTFIVNGCKEQRRARFIVDSDCTNDIRMINTPTKDDSGTLKIDKYIELQNGDFVKPSNDETFEFCIQGNCVEGTYLLHSKNNWCVMLEGLERGEYHINEMCDNGYDVRYQINGCDHEEACVELGNGNQDVTIINSRPRGGNLEISAWIRNCDDEMMRPCGSASFDVYVEHRNDTRCYTLDARNRWCILLDDLQPGKYRIIQKDSYGYDVSYENNHDEMTHGVVELNGEDQSIRIVNSMTNCQGMVTIEKFIVDEFGELTKPCPQDEFNFILRSSGFKKCFTLNASNNFCVFFDDLREGNYRIEEEDCGYETNFIINDCESEEGHFQLGREDIQVEVWNKAKPSPMLCVEKRIRTQGRLCLPDPCECYEFVITGKGVHEVYTLDVSNDFCVCLSELCNQHYEIKELHVDGCASYMINGCLQADGYFLFNGEDMTVTIINEDGCDDRVHIRKVMEEDNHDCKPYRWESFDVQIEGRNYKQRFTLNCDNDWCLEIEHLAPGNYEIKELGDYQNSFRINGEIQKDGCFFVGGGDVEIDVINHTSCNGSLQISAYDMLDNSRAMPQCGEFRFRLSTCDWQETYTLSCENEWSLYFDELPAATYSITSCDDNVCVVIDDKVGQCVEFHLECETKQAALIIQPCGNKHCLKINKKMRDGCGETYTPSCGSYEVEICCEEGNKKICLSEENDYCEELMLPEGKIEVRECHGDEALYQFNCGPLHKKANFKLCMDSTCTIYNPIATGSNVCIQAKIENENGNLEMPKRKDCFDITLKGTEYCNTMKLDCKNDWCACFENVPKGRYEICSSLEGYEQVTFMINDCDIHDAMDVHTDIDMQAIYQMEYCYGSLEILKYKKDNSCGCFIRPCQDECYEIHVWSDCFDEIVTLDQKNSWRKRFSHLPSGNYHVEEMHAQDEVSYIVNGGKEKDSAMVSIHGDASYVKVINTPCEESMGSIEIRKFIKNACNYERPKKDASYMVTLCGPYNDHTFTLNDRNDFCVIVEGLEEGTYEIIEGNAKGNVSYVVNDSCESKRAIIHVKGNQNTVQILNEEIIRGSILISKFIKDGEGKLHVPSNEEMFRVHVSKPKFNKVITLSSENNFKMRLDDLEDGWYVIDELDHEDVTYRINGGSEVDRGMVQVKKDEQDVWIINPNRINSKGSMTVTKYMRVNNRYERPNDQDVFQFHLSRPGFNEIYTLNKDNQWTQVINNLDDGSYVIQELDNANAVSYVINGGSESDFGIVDVKGNENMVYMINTLSAVSGSIQIMKYIRNAQGQLIRPSGTYSAQVHVSRPGYNQFFDLNNSNQWTINIQDLENGSYVIDEVGNTGMVSYIINGGSESDFGIVDVKDNANIVQMINQESSSMGSIQVMKYIRNGQGQLVRPSGDYAIQIHVSRPGYNQFFDLNSNNQWTVDITGLEDGSYVVDEVGNTGTISYIINGGSETDFGIVDVRGNRNMVQMINQESGSTGSIQIAKYIRDAQGQLVRPSGDYRVQVHVSRPGFNQFFNLDSSNNWTVSIRNLEDGQYVLNEVGDGNVTYIINGGSEVQNGVVRVQGNNNQVQMINHEESTMVLHLQKFMRSADGNLVLPEGNETFQISVSSEDSYQTITLNSANDFHVMLDNLTAGTYTIEEMNNNDYITMYNINGEGELPEATLEMMEGSINNVDIINERKQSTSNLEVFKYIMDVNGNFMKPNPGEVFQVTVSNANYSESYTLNEANRWHLMITDIPAGNYQLEETSQQGYTVRYMVDSGEMSDIANFVLLANKTTVVEIINEKAFIQDGTLEITKRIRNQNNELVYPSSDQTFNIRVFNYEGYNETFSLSVRNNFTMQISQLVRGSYHIEEIGNVLYDVTYMIDGGNETNDSEIVIDGSQLQQAMIINTRTAMFYNMKENQSLKIVIE